MSPLSLKRLLLTYVVPVLLIVLLTSTPSHASITYTVPDPISGSHVLSTDETGRVTEVVDYDPYGEVRSDYRANTKKPEQRGYIGEHYDRDTGLNYLNARYYDSSRGVFLSQDPVFWGDPKKQNLEDPQSLNSYGYANGNPITRRDPSGERSVGQLWKGFLSSIGSLFAKASPTRQTWMTTPVQSSTPKNVSDNTPKTTTWDSITDERIKQLNPRVQQPATNFVNDTESMLNIRLRVAQGYRSSEEQERLYWSSRTNPPGPWRTDARGGESYHNYALAIDVVVMENNQQKWQEQITPEIANIASQQGFSWGGLWSKKRDYPHFEMTLGQSISDLQREYKNR